MTLNSSTTPDQLRDSLGLQTDEILELPLEELSLRVLRAFHSSPDPSHRADHQNWLNWARVHSWPEQPDVIKALREAWQWLINKGLVLPDDRVGTRTEITRAGDRLLTHGLPWLLAMERLDLDLVPELAQRARPLFSSGKFEMAVFEAMKQVEIAVRTKAGLSATDIGTDLMSKAFRIPKQPGDPSGPLYRSTNVGGEADAVMALFRGAIGLFKNPSSHRHVPFDDPAEAADVIVLADLLLRLVRRL